MYLLKKIQSLFYLNIDNKVVHLQNSLENYPQSESVRNLLKHKHSLEVKELNVENEEDVTEWVSIINDAYDDANYDYQKGKNLLTNHLFLTDTETFLLQYDTKTIATFSIGIYKESSNIGGAFRFAVRKQFQNKGIGKLLSIYGYAKLKERGIKYGESIFASKRTASIMAHFKLGFIPQYNMKYISYKGALKNVNFIQRYRLRKRLRKQYRKYIDDFNKCFVNR